MKYVIALGLILMGIDAGVAQTVVITQSALAQLTPEQIEQAKQWARQYGIDYKIVPDQPKRSHRKAHE